MKKTYCIVSAQYLPTMGGVENYSFNLAKKLIQKGHRCVVITSSIPKLAQNEIDENGIEIIRLDSFRLLNNRAPFVKFKKKNYKLLENLLKYENLEFIINTRIYPLSLFSSYFAKKNNIPSIIIDHSSNYLSLGNKFIDFFIKIYEHIFTFLIKQFSKDFYGVSLSASSWLKTFNIASKGVLYNSIDIQKINSVDKYNLDLSKYKLNDKSRIICFVGRLIPQKGCENLLTAFQKLNFKNTFLFFAGEGVSSNFIKNNSNDNIILLGRLDYNNVISLFKQSDIFCFPTNYPEGFPTTVLEACACGCYTITTTKSGGATEIISDENFGKLINTNDIKEIQKALISALNDTNLNEKSQNAQKRVLDNYTWDITADNIENLY